MQLIVPAHYRKHAFIKCSYIQHSPSLPVTNDQLSLATANGHQTVHGFDASLHGLPHRDTRDDPRGLQTHTPALLGAQRSLKEKH